MARKVLVEVIADVSSFQKGLSKSASEAQKFEASIKGTASNVRSHILGMGTAFLGGAGFIAVVGQAVKAAESYNTALRSTDLAIKSTGGNVDAYKGKVTELAAAGAKLGFANSEVLNGLKVLTLVTGNATDATHYMGLVEDIARAKGVTLAAAATAVGKAIDGKTSSLQRYGIVAQKGESVENLLAAASKKYEGQALSNTTATEKLHATLTNLEAQIGNVLLPTIEKVATAIENWIGKSANQKRVLEDVKKAVQDATSAIKIMWDAVSKVAAVFGGWRNLMLALVSIKIASWAFGVASSLGLIGASATAALGPVSALIAALALVGTLAYGTTISSGSKVGQGTPQDYRINNGQYQRLVPTGGGRGAGITSKGGWMNVSSSEYYAATGTHPSQQGGAGDLAGDRNAQHAQILHHFGGTTTPPPLPLSYGGGGGGGGGGSKKAYKLPDALVARVKEAATAFAHAVSQQHLDTLDSLYKQEEALLRAHGDQSGAASVAGLIAAAGAKLQAKIAQLHLKAAQAAIARIETGAAGPAAALKLAQAAGQPVDVILQDQQNLLAAYASESSALRAKLAAATGKAKAAFKTALGSIQSKIQTIQDGIASSLQQIAQAAQQSLQSVLSMVETAADQQLGRSYYQGTQTPAEALLSAMQAEDTKKQLQDALTTAITAGDDAAIAAAQRAIVENDLATQATMERAQADAGYAQAVFNLNTKIEGYSAQFVNGKITLKQFQDDMTGLGVPLSQLADPGGNGLFSQLATASQNLVNSFWNLSRFLSGFSGTGSNRFNTDSYYQLPTGPDGRTTQSVTVQVPVTIDGNQVGQAVQTFAVQDLLRGGIGVPGTTNAFA